MTRRDYEKAAEIIRAMYATDNTPEGYGSPRLEKIVFVEEAFVAFFKGSAGNFDETRFRDACTPKKDKKGAKR